MFRLLKKEKGSDVVAVVDGVIKSIEYVDDQVFSKGLIGQGIAIEPSTTVVKAPCDGVLHVVFPTGHAFGITDAFGIEYLIHIGIDTVNLNGEGFRLKVAQGQHVKKGDSLVEVDFAFIKEKGLSSDTLVLVTTSQDEYALERKVKEGQSVTTQDVLFHCEKK